VVDLDISTWRTRSTQSFEQRGSLPVAQRIAQQGMASRFPLGVTSRLRGPTSSNRPEVFSSYLINQPLPLPNPYRSGYPPTQHSGRIYQRLECLQGEDHHGTYARSRITTGRATPKPPIRWNARRWTTALQTWDGASASHQGYCAVSGRDRDRLRSTGEIRPIRAWLGWDKSVFNAQKVSSPRGDSPMQISVAYQSSRAVTVIEREHTPSTSTGHENTKHGHSCPTRQTNCPAPFFFLFSDNTMSSRSAPSDPDIGSD
jgi:hypothetical protein